MLTLYIQKFPALNSGGKYIRIVKERLLTKKKQLFLQKNVIEGGDVFIKIFQA